MQVFNSLSAASHFECIIVCVYSNMAGLVIQYSDYYSELEGEVKSKYEQKVRTLAHVDPYCRLEAVLL